MERSGSGSKSGKVYYWQRLCYTHGQSCGCLEDQYGEDETSVPAAVQVQRSRWDYYYYFSILLLLKTVAVLKTLFKIYRVASDRPLITEQHHSDRSTERCHSGDQPK